MSGYSIGLGEEVRKLALEITCNPRPCSVLNLQFNIK